MSAWWGRAYLFLNKEVNFKMSKVFYNNIPEAGENQNGITTTDSQVISTIMGIKSHSTFITSAVLTILAIIGGMTTCLTLTVIPEGRLIVKVLIRSLFV